MAGYIPLKVTGNETGLVQEREEFILPNDAYPILENAYIWRERIRRKQGFTLLGQLRRMLVAQSLGMTPAAPLTLTLNIFTLLTLESTSSLQPGSVVITIGAPDTATFTDNGLGGFTATGAGVSAGSSINYSTGVVVLVFSALIGGSSILADFNYYPGLPVMGIRTKELNNINSELTVFFDTKYAYINSASGFKEWLPGTTWNYEFFWSTNYWVSQSTLKVFWVTNDSNSGDPIRYTDGTGGWFNFTPQIDVSGNLLLQALALLPFRGRLVSFNTFEGTNLGTGVAHTNRIRWAAIGNPFTTISGIITVVNPNAWRDDIRGQGGFLDIPTSEDIICVGFVRDNLVIYCENSTWQLKYTGRSIAPFQIEKVNTELGAESTFSAVQFDTSLVGVGDKGIVECDSYKSQLIDIKIPDLVFRFNNSNNGPRRVHGTRDYIQRLAYWTYPDQDNNALFPDRRLVYNYENDSWAIFTDSLTCFGTFQPPSNRTWANTKIPWQQANFSWVNRPALIPAVIAGNQQGYIEFVGGGLQGGQASNDVSLTIFNITGNTTTPTSINSPNHNLQSGQVIEIENIIGPFSNLNGAIFGVTVPPGDRNNFYITIYDPATGQFSEPQLDVPAIYLGGGQISVRDNFNITSKKFNYLDEGQNIQLGYIDLLMPTTEEGALSLNVFVNYDDDTASNTLPNNIVQLTQKPDDFFNTIINTSASSFNIASSSKTWQRVFCPTAGNFVTIQYTLSNAQMAGIEQENDVQIDAQVIWTRKAGRMSF
jgi:hypothetical protein